MSDAEGLRCPHCDTLNAPAAETCIGCQKPLVERKPRRRHSAREKELGIVGSRRRPVTEPVAPPTVVEDEPKPPVPIADYLLRAVTIILIAVAVVLGIDLRRNAPAQPTQVAIAPVETTQPTAELATATPPPVVLTATPTLPAPTDTPEPTSTPTLIPTPTLEPPYEHSIQTGEALFNLALRYNVSLESILANNPGLVPESIIAGQTILVPRPTATPPLVPVEIEANDLTLLADPTDCVMHEIAEADTYIKIAQQYDVPLDALLTMNRLSADNILQPGDQVCIPTISYTVPAGGEGAADGATFGVFNPAARPYLLYPPNFADVLELPVTLQWLSERDLAPDEYYMVEVTNLSDPLARPQRIFTRQNGVRLADAITDEADGDTFRWRVSYVRAEQEQSGAFAYGYGGPSSEGVFTLRAE